MNAAHVDAGKIRVWLAGVIRVGIKWIGRNNEPPIDGGGITAVVFRFGVLNELAVVPSHLRRGFQPVAARRERQQMTAAGRFVAVVEATGLVWVVADKAIEELVVRRQLAAMVPIVDEFFVRPFDGRNGAGKLTRSAHGYLAENRI